MKKCVINIPVRPVGTNLKGGGGGGGGEGGEDQKLMVPVPNYI